MFTENRSGDDAQQWSVANVARNPSLRMLTTFKLAIGESVGRLTRLASKTVMIGAPLLAVGSGDVAVVFGIPDRSINEFSYEVRVPGVAKRL